MTTEDLFYCFFLVSLLTFVTYFWPKPDRVEEGYEYASNEIHRLGDRAIVNLSSKLQDAKSLGDYEDFDQGVERAIQEHFKGRFES